MDTTTKKLENGYKHLYFQSIFSKSILQEKQPNIPQHEFSCGPPWEKCFLCFVPFTYVYI